MADLEWDDRPERPILRRAVRHRLRRFDSTLRVVGEDFLAESSAIDLLAVGAEGEIISIRIGRDADEARLFTQCLADLTWLRPRLADFLKLAPNLGLEPTAEPRSILVCPAFGSATRAAAENFSERAIELLSYRCYRQHGQLNVLLEPQDSAPAARTGPRDSGRAAPQPRLARESTKSPPTRMAPELAESEEADESLPHRGFRTGLSEADLRSDFLEEEKERDTI